MLAKIVILKMEINNYNKCLLYSALSTQVYDALSDLHIQKMCF